LVTGVWKSLKNFLRVRDFSKPFGIMRTRFTLFSLTYCVALTEGSTMVILKFPLASRALIDSLDDFVWSRSCTQRWYSTLSWLMKIVPNKSIRMIGNAITKNMVVFSREKLVSFTTRFAPMMRGFILAPFRADPPGAPPR